MLKITVIKTPRSATLKLEGKLAGPWVDELDRTWEESTGDTPARLTKVDLSGVTGIGWEGKKLLGRMHGQGAELHATNVMTKYILEEIKHGRNGSLKGGG